MAGQAFGSPRLKYRRQLEKQGVPKDKIDQMVRETFGEDPTEQGGAYDADMIRGKKKRKPKEAI